MDENRSKDGTNRNIIICSNSTQQYEKRIQKGGESVKRDAKRTHGTIRKIPKRERTEIQCK